LSGYEDALTVPVCPSCNWKSTAISPLGTSDRHWVLYDKRNFAFGILHSDYCKRIYPNAPFYSGSDENLIHLFYAKCSYCGYLMNNISGILAVIRELRIKKKDEVYVWL